jgi:hypothetical protein
MDRACGSYGEEEKSMRNLKGKDSCKDLCVDESIILKWIIKKYNHRVLCVSSVSA